MIRHSFLELYLRLKNLGSYLTREGYLEEERLSSAHADKIGEWGNLGDALCLESELVAKRFAEQIGGFVFPITELVEMEDA